MEEPLLVAPPDSSTAVSPEQDFSSTAGCSCSSTTNIVLSMSKRRELTHEEKAEAGRLKAIYARRKSEARARGENLTQEIVGHRCGWESAQSATNQYLNAKVPLNLEAVLKLADVLDFDVSDVSPRLAAEVDRIAGVAPRQSIRYITPEDLPPRDELPQEVLRARRIFKRINAIVEFKCAADIEKLPELTGLSFEDLKAFYESEGTPEEFDELSQKFEIALKLPEGAMSDEDGSPVSVYFYRYIWPDLYKADEMIWLIAEAMDAIRAISRATQRGLIEREHVRLLQKVVEKLPKSPPNEGLSLTPVRTKLERDKTDDDSEVFWI